jgi:hypothetical protein
MTNLELQAMIVAINASQSLTPDQRNIVLQALSKSEENGRGALAKAMEAIFGKSWRTSLFAVLFFISAMAAVIQQWVVDIGVPTKISVISAVTLKLIGSLLAGDARVLNAPPAAPVLPTVATGPAKPA